MSRIIAITNQKGGVGKTTTAVNLAACLAALGYRTLLVDLDPQGNATSGVGIDRDSLDRSVYDVFCGRCELPELVIPTHIELLSLVPARTELAGAEVELAALDGREFVLRDALGNTRELFDYVVLDCPPSLMLLAINALATADSVLVPVQAEYYALEGLARVLDTIELVRKSANRGLTLEGLLLTMHDARNNLCRQVETELRHHFADKTYETVIPRNVRLSESPSHGQPIIMYDMDSRGARSYVAFAREFIERSASVPATP